MQRDESFDEMLKLAPLFSVWAICGTVVIGLIFAIAPLIFTKNVLNYLGIEGLRSVIIATALYGTGVAGWCLFGIRVVHHSLGGREKIAVILAGSLVLCFLSGFFTPVTNNFPPEAQAELHIRSPFNDAMLVPFGDGIAFLSLLLFLGSINLPFDAVVSWWRRDGRPSTAIAAQRLDHQPGTLATPLPFDAQPMPGVVPRRFRPPPPGTY